MKTYYLKLTRKQRDQIVECQKQGGCTLLQALSLDEQKPMLTCSSISRREMNAINKTLKRMQ